MSLVGANNEEKIWNFLISKGLNEYGASGTMGNLFWESGLLPNNLENIGNTRLGMTDDEYTKAVDSGTYTKSQFINDGFGFSLAQWTYPTRKKALYECAKSMGKSIGDLEVALEYLYKELSLDYPSVLKVLKNATSVLEASNVVLLKFERPADQSISMQNKRASYGQKYYDKYASNNTTNNDNGDDNDMSYTKGKAVKLSTNFKSTEFDCHGSDCCSATKIDDKLVEYLQKIRDHFGKPITITSAYRCTKHNKNVGGSTGSYHTYGQAADIVINGVTPREVAKYAESIGILGIGLYQTAQDGYFTHIDTRKSKYFWYGQSCSPRSTFGGSTTGSSSTANSTSNTVATTATINKITINLPTIRNGSKNEYVKVLQSLLGISVDGVFGKDTVSSVKAFQKKNGLTEDGVVGKATWQKLFD